MSFDEEILIEDKYGKDRNINDLININDAIIDNNPQNTDFVIDDKKSNLKTFNDFKLEKQEQKSIIQKVESEIKNFSWHFKNSYLAIIIICLFDIVSLIFYNKFAFLNYLKLIVEIFVFIVTANYIIKRKDASPINSALVCAFVGFLSGFIIVGFKIFYLMQFWTIFNILTEIGFLIIEGFFIGLIFGGLFYSIEKSLKHKYGSIK